MTCGDGICNSDRNETCAQCPFDCGLCDHGDDLRNACPAAAPQWFSNETLGTLFGAQWHLANTGQSQPFGDLPNERATAGEDINVVQAWRSGIHGSNVTIAIVDDGVQGVHHGLQCGFDWDASYDFQYGRPQQQRLTEYDHHGTQCAGVAAGRDNSTCGVGVAFRARIAGLRLLVPRFSDGLAASGLVHALHRIDIYSNSWGPLDDGSTLERFPLSLNAIEHGVNHGRGSKGAIYIWAGGNGALTGDVSSYDELSSSRFTISVGSSDWSGHHSIYSESGANILVNAPSSNLVRPSSSSSSSANYKFISNIVTTDRLSWTGVSVHGDCSLSFGGTSGSCPIVAGVVALMLEANSALTWRDVQHVLVESARVRHIGDVSWSQNAAGKWYSPKFGFGRVDAGRAVQLSREWDVSAVRCPVCASR